MTNRRLAATIRRAACSSDPSACRRSRRGGQVHGLLGDHLLQQGGSRGSTLEAGAVALVRGGEPPIHGASTQYSAVRSSTRRHDSNTRPAPRSRVSSSATRSRSSTAWPGSRRHSSSPPAGTASQVTSPSTRERPHSGTARGSGRNRGPVLRVEGPFDDDPVGAAVVILQVVVVAVEPPADGAEHVEVEVGVARLQGVVGPAHRPHAGAQGHLGLRSLELPAHAAALRGRVDSRRLRIVVGRAPVEAHEPVGEAQQAAVLVERAQCGAARVLQRAQQLRRERRVVVGKAEHHAVQPDGGEPLGRGGEGSGDDPGHAAPAVILHVYVTVLRSP